jgi:hypothetical protein
MAITKTQTINDWVGVLPGVSIFGKLSVEVVQEGQGPLWTPG